MTDEEKLNEIQTLIAKRKAALEKDRNNSNYLENPKFIEFNRIMREHGFAKTKKYIKLGTIDETYAEVQEYFDLCEIYGQLPSVKSLVLYLGIGATTFYTHMRNTDSEYSELFRASLDYIHSVIENGAMNNKVNPATYMFTASNFYGMRDSRSIDVNAISVSTNNGLSTRESILALREQIAKEESEKKDNGIIENIITESADGFEIGKN